MLYTKAYENEGTPVLTLSGTYTGRTAITVRAETEGGITEYSVSSIDEDTFDGLPIPHNGFVLTLPTASLEGLRIRSGMAVPVAGDDVLGGLERMDVGTFRPNNEYRNILKRRISFADPVAGVSAEGIYYLSAEYTKNAIPLPAGSAVAVLQDGKVGRLCARL